KEMTLGEHRGERETDRVVLAEDSLRDVVDKSLEGLTEPTGLLGGDHSAFSSGGTCRRCGVVRVVRVVAGSRMMLSRPSPLAGSSAPAERSSVGRSWAARVEPLPLYSPSPTSPYGPGRSTSPARRPVPRTTLLD